MQSKRALVGRVNPPMQPPADTEEKGRVYCGAHSRRTGRPCKNFAMPNGRCRMHGGKNTGNRTEQPKTAGIKFGIYADVGLLPDEYPVYEGITGTIGTLNEEIHMARIKLRRCYKAQARLDQVRDEMALLVNDREAWLEFALGNGVLTLAEVETKEGQALVGDQYEKYLEDYANHKLVKKVHDYSTEIRHFTTLILRLEAQRKELLEGGTGGEDFVRQLAEDLRGFNDNAMGTLPVDNGGGLGSGNYPELEARNGQ